MAIDETQQYVDWAGLRYYDQRVKAYIDTKCNSSEDSQLIKATLEELDRKVDELHSVDIKHIHDDIDAIRDHYVSKSALVEEIKRLETQIKTLTGVDFSDYVKYSDIQDFVTREELDEELRKVTFPEVDTSKLVTREELTRVEQSIPSVEGLASETYVDEKVASIIVPEVPTKVSELENDAGYLTDVPEEYVTDEELEAKGYLTEHQSLEGLATEQFVADELAKLDCVTSDKVESLIDEKIEAAITDGATVSSISYGTF